MNTGSMRYSRTNGTWARWANVVLGVWLFISAFAWRHSSSQMTNTWILGVIATVFALIAAYASASARFVNTVVAIWLFIAAFALPSVTSATVANNVIVAILMFVFSLVPSEVHRPGVGAPRPV